MKQLTLFFLLLFSSVVNAQEAAKIRVTYELNTIRNKKYSVQELWALDIGDTTTIFYTPNERKAVPLIDSLQKRITDDIHLFLAKHKEIRNKYPGGSPMQVLRGLPQAGKSTCLRDGCGQSYMLYECEDPIVEWDVQDTTKTVCGYACQQAVGKLYGRTWTVWFAEEFPLPYGPFILGGLPGMVLEAYDADNIYHYTAIGIENLENGPEIKIFKDYYKVIECSREQYLKARQKYESMTPQDYVKRTGLHLQGGSSQAVSPSKPTKQKPGTQRRHLDLE